MCLENNNSIMNPPRHDLLTFISQVSENLAKEYERIQLRVKEDPGTAGDQGEENWADILRDWLPQSYAVVTKGRILGHQGEASRQVDVIVLRPGYPRCLLSNKHYLAGGVAAAFECKVTLESHHIDKAMENAVQIRNLVPKRIGSPYLELNTPILYGLLAHSHAWKSQASHPFANINDRLHEADRAKVSHPREMLDLLCVSDVATWVAHKTTRLPAFERSGITPFDGAERYLPIPLTCHMALPQDQPASGQCAKGNTTPVGAMMYSLMSKLAWEDVNLRPIATYFRLVGVGGSGSATTRPWPMSIYSEAVNSNWQLPNPLLEWDEWGEGVG